MALHHTQTTSALEATCARLRLGAAVLTSGQQRAPCLLTVTVSPEGKAYKLPAANNMKCCLPSAVSDPVRARGS